VCVFGWKLMLRCFLNDDHLRPSTCHSQLPTLAMINRLEYLVYIEQHPRKTTDRQHSISISVTDLCHLLFCNFLRRRRQRRNINQHDFNPFGVFVYTHWHSCTTLVECPMPEAVWKPKVV